MKYIIYNKTCEDMKEVSDDIIGAYFTSPPYALAKNYGENNGIGMSDDVDAYKDYLRRMYKVFQEVYRILKPGRYVGINIADVSQQDKVAGWHKKPIRYHYFNMLSKIGFVYIDTICWKKPGGITTQKRFGLIIQNPYPLYYRPNNLYEPILIFKKPGGFELTKEEKEENKLNWRNFSAFQTDIWEIFPENNVSHPAPFPWRLPLIFYQLYSLKGEIVMDSFVGSGSSVLAARKCRRQFIGYEINPDYIELIKDRSNFNQNNQGILDTFGDFGTSNDDTLEVIK